MTAAKNAGIAGLVLGALSATALGVAKGIAMNDRRRAGQSRDQIDTAVTAQLTQTPNSFPTTHHQLTMADGASIHVVLSEPRVGVPVIVLLHGVTLSSQIWSPAMTLLCDDYQVVAMDWRGHGRSVAGAAGFGLDLLASDLAEVLTQLSLSQCVIVGHSMGGMALMQFCGSRSEAMSKRVKALMFLSTACADVGVTTVPAFLRGAVRRMLQSGPISKRASWTAPGDLGYSMVRATFGDRPDPVWVEAARDIVSEMDSDATAASFVPILSHNATKILPHITIPVTVVVGTQDRLTPPTQAKRTASLIKHARLVILEGPGHMIMLERQPEFVALVRELAQ
jgi:pimeloyl-ACP methyl ester carboxylesterase